MGIQYVCAERVEVKNKLVIKMRQELSSFFKINPFNQRCVLTL